MATFTGIVTKIEVEDTSKTATVVIDPPGITPPDTFKVTNDSDSSFGAMVSVLARARGTAFLVTVESGADKEINKLTL